MPEEEIEYLDDDNENNNDKNNGTSRASSRSSLKNVASSVAGAVLDNKYKSKKNSLKSSSDDNSPSMKSRIGSGIKNGVTNAVLNKVSNAHPALKAANTVRNLVTRNNNPVNSSATYNTNSKKQDRDVLSSNVDDDANESVDDTSVFNGTNEETETKSVSPLGSLFGGTSGFLGQFSFWGRIPISLKIGMLLAPVFILVLVLLVPSSIVSMFSGLLGTDEVIASGSGTSGNIDYGDYELSSDGDEILHESLDSFLASQGTSLEEFNNLIASNVENSGYGTDAGVVAAAVTLIAELGNNYDVKIPYFWGGGHGQMITGAEGNWGSNQCRASANGRIYDYCGLDCSGFVAWAIWNGGFNIAARVTGQFQDLPGAERVSLSSSSAVLAPGDLLESNSHIVLVIGVDEETNEYICAEASGYTTGVLFTRRPFSRSGYWGVRMSGFYERQVRS